MRVPPIEVSRESEIFCGMRGIQHAPTAHVRYSELVRRFKEDKNATVREAKTVRDYVRVLNNIGEFLRDDIRADQITLQTLESSSYVAGNHAQRID